ncbi:MAG: DUF1501 domain-containing protein [Chloroflexi bacterium]|nr:DUF1501 domain-containing protein [Chloroflexota bacterium]
MPFTRRDFLTRGALLVAMGLTAPSFLTQSVEAALSGQSGPARRRMLVVVQLGGGNDGLNTVVPLDQPRYYTLRPTLAIPRAEALTLADGLGLHPNLAALKQHYDAGQVAIVQGVGYPNPNRSHFRSMEIWETASLGPPGATGWLGRYVDATCCGTGAPAGPALLPAVNVDGSLQQAMWTEHAFVPAIGSLAAFQFRTIDGESPDEQSVRMETFRRIYAETTTPRVYDTFLRQVAVEAFDVSAWFERIANTYRPAVQYPNTGFAQRLRTIAQLVHADLGTRVFYVGHGGFDTHVEQARDHAALLRTLAEGLSAFLRDLEARGRLDDVLVLCFSEFGRRVRENTNRGTDHGTAQPLFLLGGAAKAGLVGPTPSFDIPDTADPEYQIDFRSVYASVLEEWMLARHEPVLGHRFATLGLMRGTSPAPGGDPPPAPPAERPAPLERMSAAGGGTTVYVPSAPTAP